MPTAEQRKAAIADVIGALCYALLRSFEAATHALKAAPTTALAERQAAFATEEYERYRVLRARLSELTTDPDRSMDAFRIALDAFYRSTVAEDWLESQVFQFVGDTITTDFADIIGARLDEETAAAVRRSLTDRGEQETFALEQIMEALSQGDDEAQKRMRAFAGTMVGQALNTLREALETSDALEVVLGEGGTKEVVLELLGRHRERLERLGLDSIE
ncbi:MAG TPA: ferritin-like fold-containing protein [Actinomycetota bacterium]|nr:ferritin-like fold-containing protein [Actinomycetota bacterium]